MPHVASTSTVLPKAQTTPTATETSIIISFISYQEKIFPTTMQQEKVRLLLLGGPAHNIV